MPLKAIDLLFLHQINGNPKHVLKRYDFWLRDDKTIDQRLESLLEAKFLHESTHLATKLSQFTIPVIKELLKSQGLKVSGNKEILLTRLNDYEGFIDLSHLKIETVYVVDDSLKPLMDQTKFLTYMSMNGPLSIEDAYAFYLRHPELSESEVIIKLHEEAINANQNIYQVIKCHLLLADYYEKQLHLQDKSLIHLNKFTLLIVLESMKRYHEMPHTSGEVFFDIDNYTVEKYRSLLRMKQCTLDDLYQGFLSCGADLCYKDEAITLASQFIIRYIINSDTAEEKLISQMKDGDYKS